MGYGYHTPEERLQRFTIVILAIATIVLGIVAISNCSNNSHNEVSPLYPDDPDDEETTNWDTVINEPIIEEPPLRESLDRVMNTPQTISIQPGDRYEDIFWQIYPELDKRDKKLGGAKLLGETCADAHGNYKSRSTRDETCYCPRTCDLGIGVENSDDGLPNRMNKGEVATDVSPIDSHGEWSLWYAIFGLSITIENLTGTEMDVVIRQGLLLETLGDDVQNIVIRKTVTVHLQAFDKQTVRVTALCASHHRSSPVGFTARITPFYLMAEPNVFDSQEALWQWQEDLYAPINGGKN